MRTYIFTTRERRLLKRWISKDKRDRTLDMIIHRVRHFKYLEKDVELYLAIKQKLKQASSPQ